MKRLAFIVGLLLLFSSADAKRPPLPEPDPKRGTIGVTIKAIPPAKIGKMTAVQVHFVRVQNEEDILNAEYVIASNYSRKDQVYLLNAKPGRYVAVAAEFKKSTGFEYHAFFAEDMIPQTEVTVTAGEMIFMGEYPLNTSTKMTEGDAAQTHYYQMILPSTSRQGFMSRTLFGGVAPYVSTLKESSRDTDTEKEFWSRAQMKVFKKEPVWQARVQHELEAMIASEPVAEAVTD